MAVVRDFYIGNTHIKINDEYCRNKTKEEVDAILERIADITMPYMQAEELRRCEAEEKKHAAL